MLKYVIERGYIGASENSAAPSIALVHLLLYMSYKKRLEVTLHMQSLTLSRAIADTRRAAQISCICCQASEISAHLTLPDDSLILPSELRPSLY